MWSPLLTIALIAQLLTQCTHCDWLMSVGLSPCPADGAACCGGEHDHRHDHDHDQSGPCGGCCDEHESDHRNNEQPAGDETCGESGDDGRPCCDGTGAEKAAAHDGHGCHGHSHHSCGECHCTQHHPPEPVTVGPSPRGSVDDILPLAVVLASLLVGLGVTTQPVRRRFESPPLCRDRDQHRAELAVWQY